MIIETNSKKIIRLRNIYMLSTSLRSIMYLRIIEAKIYDKKFATKPPLSKH